MHIHSNAIARPIPEGSQLEVHVEVDTSRHILVEIYVPYLNKHFSNGVFVPEDELKNPMEQADYLPQEIEQHYQRLNDLKNNLPKDTLQDVYTEIKKAEIEIESVDVETGKIFNKGLPSSSDYDNIAKTAAASRKIRESLAKIEVKLGIDRSQVERLEQLENLVKATKAAVDELGTIQDKKEFELLVRDLDIAISNNDQRGLNRGYEMMDGLRWRIFFGQDWFWADMFNSLKQTETGFMNRTEAEKWVIRGDNALQSGNFQELREAVRNLWKLQKPDVLEKEREKALPSGLRKS
jgi:hypothetical protein